MSTLENLIEEIITSDADGKQLIDFAKKKAQELKSLKKNQIRKVFSEVRQIETLWDDEVKEEEALRRLNLLKPKLYYQTQRKREIKPLAEVLYKSINFVVDGKGKEEKKKRFNKFVDLFEAILAYHRG